jgi:hypothetical protein
MRISRAEAREGSRPRDPEFVELRTDRIRAFNHSDDADLSAAREDARPPPPSPYPSLP